MDRVNLTAWKGPSMENAFANKTIMLLEMERRVCQAEWTFSAIFHLEAKLLPP